MKWGSIIDGKNLYYIPSDEVEITLPDGTVTTTHPRLIYNLDTETGEETVAFNFDGDYVALSVGFMSNDLIVYDNKIFTAELRNFSGNAIPQAACMVHNVSTGNYSYSGGIVIDNEFYCTSTLSLSSNDVLYIAIANAGTSGTLSYSYSISVSD